MPLREDIKDVQETVINELTSANGLTTTLVSNSVTESEIASGAVIEGKIGASAVTETKIANGAVTAAKLGSDVDLTPADGSITPAKLDRAYLESTGGSVSGNVGIGTTSPSSYNSAGDNLVIAETSGGAGLTLASSSTGSGHILFADGTTGTGAYDGFIRFDHTTSSMRFASGGGIERMRIQSDGTIKISNSSEPSTPSGGGVLYVQNGALKFKGSSGTVTTIANA